MTTRQIAIGLTAWVVAVGSVASLSWVAIDSAGHDADPHGGVQRGSQPAALPPSPSATTPADPVATPNVSKPSPSVVETTTRPASTTSPVVPRQTTQRSRTSHAESRSTTTTRRPRWSRTTDDDFHVEQTTAPTVPWPGAGTDTVPIGDSAQADDFGAWLADLAPTGYSVSFVPWWYGGSDGSDPRAGYGSSDGGYGYHASGDWDRHDSGYRNTGYDRGSAGNHGTGSGSGWLRLDSGLVRVDCDGSQLLDWSATPWDGWDVSGGRSGAFIQVRFSARSATVDVQAGCAGDRPAFRYREGDDEEWRTSLT